MISRNPQGFLPPILRFLLAALALAVFGAGDSCAGRPCRQARRYARDAGRPHVDRRQRFAPDPGDADRGGPRRGPPEEGRQRRRGGVAAGQAEHGGPNVGRGPIGIGWCGRPLEGRGPVRGRQDCPAGVALVDGTELTTPARRTRICSSGGRRAARHALESDRRRPGLLQRDRRPGDGHVTGKKDGKLMLAAFDPQGNRKWEVEHGPAWNGDAPGTTAARR